MMNAIKREDDQNIAIYGIMGKLRHSQNLIGKQMCSVCKYA